MTTAKVEGSSRKSNPARGSKKGERRGGRRKGTPNKVTAALKDAILQAAESAHPQGTVGYLTQQARGNPAAFMALLGKTLPKEITGADGVPLVPPVININPVQSKP